MKEERAEGSVKFPLTDHLLCASHCKTDTSVLKVHCKPAPYRYSAPQPHVLALRSSERVPVLCKSWEPNDGENNFHKWLDIWEFMMYLSN